MAIGRRCTTEASQPHPKFTLKKKMNFRQTFGGKASSNQEVCRNNFGNKSSNHPSYFIKKDSLGDNSETNGESYDFNDHDLTRRKFDNKKFHINKNCNRRSSMGIENMIYTNFSTESVVLRFRKKLHRSKIFKFIANFDFKVNLNFFSTTEFYHPQLLLWETRDEINFNIKEGNQEWGMSSTEYSLYRDHIYIIEIGTDQSLFTMPFQDIEDGGFVAVFSSQIESLPYLLDPEKIEISAEGREGTLNYKQKGILNLMDSSGRTLNFGELDYSITPYYNHVNRSITLYYIKGSKENKGQHDRACMVTLRAVGHVVMPGVNFGTWNHGYFYYYFNVESHNVMEIISLLEG